MRTFNRIALAITAACFIACTGVPRTAAPPQPPQPRATPAQHTEQGQTLRSLMLPGGMFERLDGSLYVRPAFWRFDATTRQACVELAYRYAYSIPPDVPLTLEDNAAPLYLLDAHTGRRVGRFDYCGLRYE